MLNWIDKFEQLMGDTRGVNEQFSDDVAWLRRIVMHQQSDYNEGPSVDEIVEELVNLGRQTAPPRDIVTSQQFFRNPPSPSSD